MDNIERQLLLQLSKFFKYDGEFKSIDEIKTLYNISDENLNMIVKIIKNRIDPISWINNIKINHPNRGIIPFKTYDFQNDVVKLWITKHFLITLKSRQIGLSTITEAICLWCALNYQNYTILILSVTDEAAKEFLDDTRNMYDNMTIDSTIPKRVTNNEHKLEFDNGSQIIARPATDGSTRGLSINLMVIDEAAAIPHIDEVYQAAYPVISRAFPPKDEKSSKPYGVIVISTPAGISGKGKWFYDMYTGAVSGRNQYCPVRIHWKQVPEFTEEWYYDMCENFNYDNKKIAAELDLSFISSGNTFIPNAILDTIDVLQPKDKDMGGKLWIWEEPIENETYIIGVDVAYGDKNDSSVIQVIKGSTLEQVAEYESNSITVPDFEEVVYDICLRYKNHLINIERNAVGKSLIDLLLKDHSTASIHYYRDVNPNDIRNKPGQTQTVKDNIGTSVTAGNRDLLLSNMYQLVLQNYLEGLSNIVEGDDNLDKEAARAKFEAIKRNEKTGVNKKLGIIKSERLYNQLLTFVTDNKGKVQGKHDDLIMAWIHALYCYTKNKPIILSGLLNAMDKAYKYTTVPTTIKRNIEFMKKFDNTGMWNNIDESEYAMELEQQYLREQGQENQFNSKDNEKDPEMNNALNALSILYGFKV